MYAVISAGWAGASAAGYVSKESPVDLNNIDLDKIENRIFAPTQDKNSFLPQEAISILGDVTSPMKYNLRRSKKPRPKDGALL
jgi:hypothetical protein